MSTQTVRRLSSVVSGFYQMRSHGLHRFRSKVEIYGEVGPFIYKTVTDSEELKEALALRWEVFHHEMIGKPQKIGMDVDRFDLSCDHLVIKDKKTQQIVGTYRINCSLFTNDFYSAQEFNISNILKQDGVKLELGRACIHKDFRRGIVISLLWRGIADYMAATNAQYLFGCASVKTSNSREAVLLYKHFEQEGRLVPEYYCSPTLDFSMPSLNLWVKSVKGPLTEAEQDEVEKLLPPLCRSYLKIGAFIGGEPAFDREFNCIDFLTILHREDINRTIWKRSVS